MLQDTIERAGSIRLVVELVITRADRSLAPSRLCFMKRSALGGYCSVEAQCSPPATRHEISRWLVKLFHGRPLSVLSISVTNAAQQRSPKRLRKCCPMRRLATGYAAADEFAAGIDNKYRAARRLVFLCRYFLPSPAAVRANAGTIRNTGNSIVLSLLSHLSIGYRPRRQWGPSIRYATLVFRFRH